MTTQQNFTMTDEDVANKPVDVQVVLATRKVQANNPELDYVEAQELALSANPKLARAYLDSNGTFNRDGGVQRPNYEQEA